jgi:hypothetical protein
MGGARALRRSLSQRILLWAGRSPTREILVVARFVTGGERGDKVVADAAGAEFERFLIRWKWSKVCV